MKEDPLPIILNILSQVDINFFQIENILIFFLIITLLTFSAFISGAEISYFSLSMSDLEKLREDNTKNNLIFKLFQDEKDGG